MKAKLFLLCALAATLTLGTVSCDKDNDNENTTTNTGGGNGGDNPGDDDPDVDPTTLVWVDLGLPSGLLWADRNVGADTPEGYGSHFAWGENTPKDYYNWDTYVYGSGEEQLTRYCNNPSNGLDGYTDDLTILLPEDDAATVNLDGEGRTPTKEEWDELIYNTSASWVTRNGVKGKLFTSTNGNSIFLPAAGDRLDGQLSGQGTYCAYWASNLDQDHQYGAWRYAFFSTYRLTGYDLRCGGFSVRAVRSEN